jgi:isochorismate hydrolase
MKPSSKTLQQALVIRGATINTHACVRATAVEAFQRDYKVIMATA